MTLLLSPPNTSRAQLSSMQRDAFYEPVPPFPVQQAKEGVSLGGVPVAAFTPPRLERGSPPPATCRYVPFASPSKIEEIGQNLCLGYAVSAEGTSRPFRKSYAPFPLTQARETCLLAPSPASPPLPPRPPQKQGAFQSGDKVTVGSTQLEIQSVIGKGNFGTVWAAVDVIEPNRKLLALKCSSPLTQSDLESAMTEVDVLRNLTEKLMLNGTFSAIGSVPQYLAHKVDAGTVRLAMTMVPGVPLDQFLYGPQGTCKHLQTIVIDRIIDGPMEGSQMHSRSFREAAFVSASLMEQMAPVFNALSTIAYHRDIAAHNFLIQADREPVFGLIDFGLAVKARSWKNEYRSSNLAGTPHYFPPSTWMILAYGHKYLESHPELGLLRMYKERLDHFAMGLLSLELLFVLWDGIDAVDTEDKGISDALDKARIAWRSYWSRALLLYQQFFNKGPSKLRPLLAGGLLTQLVKSLQTLVDALRTAAASGIAAPAGRVLAIAAELLDCNSMISWADVTRRLRSQDEGLCSPSAKAPAQKYSHRRVRTVDEAVSLTRDVPDVSTGFFCVPFRTATGQKYNHRRISTVDEAASLARDVPDISTFFGSEGAPHATVKGTA
jgi:serine/threonine protein kinase